MNKTVILNTKQGTIVKVPTTLANYDAAVRRAEKKIGKELHYIAAAGDFNVLCDRYHQSHLSAAIEAGLRAGGPKAAARLVQAKAMRALVAAFAGRPNPSSLPKNWVAELRKEKNIAPVALRYAFSPDTYTAPAFAPELP